MAKKKKKSVLDYDPLAWLNDEEQKNEVSAKSAEPELDKGNTMANETPENNEAFGFFSEEETAEDFTQVEDDGFGFFADEQPSSEVEASPVDENSHYGFFGDEPAEVEPESDESGFGFFADDEVTQSVKTEVLDIKKDEAINLGSELTIKSVSDMKGIIDQLINSDSEIVINAEEVIKVDTAGLQLLFSLKESLSKTGHHIKWIGTSSVINDSAEIIGMPVLAPKSKDACYGFFEENMKDAADGSSGFF